MNGDESTRGGRRAADGRDALIVFLGVTTALLLLLVILTRVRPGWFDRSGEGVANVDPIRFEPRGADGGDHDASGVRESTARRPDSPTVAELVFADTMPSVVHVRALALGGTDAITPIAPVIAVLGDIVSGTGSGIVWDRAGHIVTCKHVLDNVDGATVTFADGRQWSAKYVGVDDEHDLAIVRIGAPASALTPIRVGTSSDLTIGMRAFSVASPYGLGHSLSIGSVSGLGRRIRSTSGSILENVIQTDAAIHRGSSGGALVDDQARVIGLNAAIHSESERSLGVGFSIPMDAIRELVPRIIERGYRWYPRFGFVVAGDEESAARLAGLPAELGSPVRGIVVVDVDRGSPAGAAGLREMGRREATIDQEELIIVRDIVVRVAVGDGPAEEATRASLDRCAAEAAESGERLTLVVARREGEVEVALTATPGHL